MSFLHSFPCLRSFMRQRQLDTRKTPLVLGLLFYRVLLRNADIHIIHDNKTT